jgi:hypothetical protein
MVGYRFALGVRRVCCAGALWLTVASLTTAAESAVARPATEGPSAAVAAEGDIDPALYRDLTVVRTGSSSAAIRKQALAELPLDELSPAARAKAQRVLQNMGLFRRLPTLAFDVEPSVYHYLLQHPDVAVSTWRAMDISKFELKQVGPNRYHADAGDGSVGDIEVWRSTPDDTLIYCDGAFKSPLVTKPIVARSIMRLRTRMVNAAGEPPRAECSGEVYVEFPSQAVETIAKVISPISHSIADRNFKQLSLYAHLMSQAMTRQPGWVRQLADRMDADAEQRAALLQLGEQVHLTAQRRAGRAPEPMPVDELLKPLKLPVQREAIVPVSGRGVN